MSEVVARKGNPQWTKGMPSPNPSGRPPGAKDKRARIAEALLDDAQEIVRVVIDKALDGDVQAAGLVLARVAPVLRSQAERVSFALDAKAPLAEQVEAVLQAVSEGKVAPDVGKQIIETVGALGAIRQVDAFEARLAALEGRKL